jgi:hypothetical protein
MFCSFCFIQKDDPDSIAVLMRFQLPNPKRTTVGHLIYLPQMAYVAKLCKNKIKLIIFVSFKRHLFYKNTLKLGQHVV